MEIQNNNTKKENMEEIKKKKKEINIQRKKNWLRLGNLL